MYTPLHVYTGSSFLESGLRVKEYVASAAKQHFLSIGISDINTFRGVPEFVHECQKVNIKPIIGIDLTIDNLLFSFFVKNETGYLNLLKLFNYSQRHELSIDNVRDFNDGLVVVLTTTTDSFKSHFEDEKFNYWLAKLTSGIDDFYLGLDVDSNDYFTLIKIREFALSHTYQVVAFPHVKYLNPKDAISLEMVHAIEKSETLEIKELSGNQYLKNEEELLKHFTNEELNATNEIANKVDFNFIMKRGKLIHFVNNENIPSSEYLHNLVKESLKAHGFLKHKSYVERAKYELDVINQMGYADYFLLVADYVNWAKKQGILVAPGRGSAAASLIAYCLGITGVDPLKYNLLFERFLNIERQTMPDIDVDFQDTKRGMVFDYLRQTYGQTHVANILAVQNIGARQSIRDIGKLYKVDEKIIDRLAKSLDGDLSLRENYRQNKTFKNIVDEDRYFLSIVSLASKIEGLPRQSSLHAAGVVLNDESLEEVMPIAIDNDGNYIGEFEKDYLEEQDFLKMDILGNEHLTIIENCLNRIKERTGKELKYEDIPYDDYEAIRVIASGRTAGIFQLKSVGMRDSIKLLNPTCFEDVVALLALYRPGPMANIPHYAQRKAGLEKYSFISPAVEEILSPTYGIIVYQEQIMMIANKMAGFTLGQADLLRSAISKKKTEKLLALKDSFIKGCINNGYSEVEATKVYDYIYKFGDYGFNKAHSLVYAVLSCQMAYLKKYYPTDFYATMLDNENGSENETFNMLINEIKSMNISLAVPSVNESTLHYNIKDGKVLLPLNAIKGLSPLNIKGIIEERTSNGPYKDIFDFVLRTHKLNLGINNLNRLIDAGAFDCLGETRNTYRHGLDKAFKYAAALNNDSGEMVIDITFLPPPALRQMETNLLYDLNKERDAIGYMVSGSPLSIYKDKTDKIKKTNIADLVNVVGEVTLVGVISTVKVKNDKKGEQMAFVDIYDDTGKMFITVFSSIYQTTANFIKKGEVVVAKGYYDSRKEKYNFNLDELYRLEDY